MSKRKGQIKHYLLTLTLSPEIRMHGYLMTDDKRCVEAAINQLMDKLEKAGVTVRMNIWLVTELGDSAKMVREIVAAQSPDVQRLLDEATDYHFSAWTWSAALPDDARLMRLH